MKKIFTPFKEGDTRVKRFFAWIPVLLQNEMRWLEFVTVRQYYMYHEWNNYEFIDKEQQGKQ